MKKVFFVLVFVQCMQNTKAQRSEIKGQVRDAQTNEVLSGTTVTIDKKNLTVYSNTKGYFTIFNPPPGNQTLSFSFVGYETLVKYCRNWYGTS